MSIGTFTVRPLDPLEDAGLLHRWITHPKAAFWMMQDARIQDVEREYMRIAAHEHHHAHLGLHDGEPAFLMETYDPGTSNSPACTTPNPAMSACTSWSPPPTGRCTASPGPSSRP
ncbi:hypothetical protein SHKM778_81400 [Streptomyces sp. KM77-8]|uniref:Lysine N-acyltransferase MbtK n=1 Tax=Streptomyces haneummycinicus TaxID=3074435 RepID=A0AAT9HXQ7_9ACTN